MRVGGHLVVAIVTAKNTPNITAKKHIYLALYHDGYYIGVLISGCSIVNNNLSALMQWQLIRGVNGEYSVN